MYLRDILKAKGTKVWTIRDTETVEEALRVLVNQNIGALVVLNWREEVVGIISERDIVHAAFRLGKALHETPVSKLMTHNIIMAGPDDLIRNIMATMTERRVRHIPVMAQGELKGLISIGDVVKFLIEDSEHQIRFLKEYLYGPSL